MSLLLVDHFYDLNVPTGRELDIGQKNVTTPSCSVLSGWQPTKLTHLIGSYFEVYKDCPIAFWLS